MNKKIAGISALLVDNKLISFTDMKDLYDDFKTRDDISFEDFLLEEAILSKEELLQILSKYYKVPYFDTTGAFFDHHFLTLIPKDIMLEHIFIPYKRDVDSDILTVVAAEPDNAHLLEVLGQYIFHEINFMVGLPQDILDAIEEFHDESITYQPNYIQNQKMERSMMDVHPLNQMYTEREEEIPVVWQDNVDDSERG